ncbi:HTH-type transcriptional regulator PgrR [Paraburkholderia rhynchosiae]|nr:HTH-type transcriptional regulator PgrR [Paraburkholderia rhynchosiae]
MRGLEAKLSVRLFNRTTRSVALTEAGEKLFRRVRPAVSDLEDAINEVVSTGDRPTGTIKISASAASALPLVRHVVPAFVEHYPDIHVEFVTDSRLIDIVANGFDAGIRLRDDVPRDMIAVQFQPAMTFAAIASPAYLERHGLPKEPHELADHRCICFRFGSGALLEWELIRRGRSAHVGVDGALTLDDLNLVVQAALAGIGIAWMPVNHVSEHIAAGRLVRLLAEWSPSFPGLCLYYPANRHLPTGLRLFSDAVRSWAKTGGNLNGG